MNSVPARFLLAFLAVIVSLPAHAETLTGTVVGVADGDTITVLDANREQHKIRLGAIDAPEKAQPFGQRSKESLSTMVFGKEVDVRWNKRDRYQRIVGKVWVQPVSCPTCPKTLDAGLAQLTVGLAWWYRKYAKEQSPEDAGRYEFAEQEARVKRVGLWSDPQPIPPWDWRKGERVMQMKQWPATVDEAVGVVIATLSDDERASIASLPKSELIGLHFGLGMWIRNNLGLWSGNDQLMQAVRKRDQSIHPDDASMVIVEAVWERLREMVPKVH